jgi:transcriptional regulator with XRE-family HTH domain
MALRIKELRDQKGWTQAELAARSNMSRSQLAMIETETRPANTLRLNSIAAALDVKPEDLFVSSGWRSRLSAATKDLSEADREMLVHMAEALAAKAQKAE